MSQQISLNDTIEKFEIPESQLRKITNSCLRDGINLFVKVDGDGFTVQTLDKKDTQKVFSKKKSLKVHEKLFKLVTEENIYTNAQRSEKLNREKEDIFFNSDDESKVQEILEEFKPCDIKAPSKKEKNILCVIDIARIIKTKYLKNPNLYKKDGSINARVISDLAHLPESKELRQHIYKNHNKKKFTYDTFYRRLCDGIKMKLLS